MKLRKFLPSFIILFAFSIVITSCLNDDNLIPPNCNDGLLNNGEFDVDCGGPACDPCPPSCVNGLWDPDFGEIDIDCGGPNCDPCPTCNDEELNQDEIGIDCGGEECDPCTTSGSCINGILDGDETGVDCGGTHCPDCPVVTCDDGMMNGDETGIDCGGANCPACPDPTCEDGVLNGLETGIDCGDGLFCPPCQEASQGQIIFRTNNSPFEVYSGSAVITGDMVLNLNMSGSGGSTEQLTFILANAEGFGAGSNVSFNSTTAAAGLVVGLEYAEFGNYLTNTPSSNIDLTFTEYGTENGDVISGTFSGIMFNFSESFSQVITEGSFNLIVTVEE